MLGYRARGSALVNLLKLQYGTQLQATWLVEKIPGGACRADTAKVLTMDDVAG